VDFNVEKLFIEKLSKNGNVYITSNESIIESQAQTNEVFSEKWGKYNKEEITKQEKLFDFQKKWYLDLYGFGNENELKKYLSDKDVILDAGCGLGYKAKWFADLSPNTLVLAMDYSNAVFHAEKKYHHYSNMIFIKGDIANTKLKNNVLDYVSCDQVIHHTEDPLSTMKELTRVLKPKSEFAVYVYAKKALPRELLDEYFRAKTKTISNEDMWKFSEQMTELGKRLTDLKIEFNSPEIPLLGIKGGKIDLQRFIYWNFIKCFWNEELGLESSISTNYDWYAPSNAERYTKDEFLSMILECELSTTFIHSEEACHSGRFEKN
jgi:ubiquinone/menaquinone biosynthesis C-methylase UbiE